MDESKPTMEEHVYHCECGADHKAFSEASSLLYGKAFTCACGRVIDTTPAHGLESLAWYGKVTEGDDGEFKVTLPGTGWS